METVAFLGLLGLGYFASQSLPKDEEGFTDSTATVSEDRTPMGAPTVPGFPRQPRTAVTGEYDRQFQLPAGGSLSSEPNPSALQAGPLHLPVAPPTLPSQMDLASQAILQTRPDRWEDATQRPAFVSPLSGIEFKPGEFKHANMVPFFRGQAKQSMVDTANNQVLDSYTGASKTLFAKREQTPFFEPTKEPIGNPYGFESTTNFMESRIVESRNKANERPMESIRVGPGLNQGYTHLGSGGFQQQAGEDYVQSRMPRTNDLRVATNPKLSYDAPVVPGQHFIANSGDGDTIGEVRKYNPDKFFINENGERNFVTVGADQKAAIRSAQVIKHTTRPETTKAYSGIGGQAEGKATYTIGSTRTPLVKQMGSWGFRNADLSENFNPDTDAPENDYGKSGVEIRPNERFYTGERVHATNVKPDAREVELPLQDVARPTRAEELIDNAWIGTVAPASAQPRLTVYDPNDVARTTIKETTVDNDYLGISAPADRAQKLTTYDPDDIARVTGRNTLDDWDTYRNAGRADTPEGAEIRLQDAVRNTQKAAISAKSSYTGTAEAVEGRKFETRLQDNVRNTQKAAISAKSSYTGIAESTEYQAETSRVDAMAMRHYAQRENVARGRKPMGSSTKVFNGEDNINLQYRRIVADSINDREPALDNVNSEPTSAEVIGVQRPRTVLKLDVSAIRNEPVMVAALERNPYVIPLHRAAMVGGANAL